MGAAWARVQAMCGGREQHGEEVDAPVQVADVAAVAALPANAATVPVTTPRRLRFATPGARGDRFCESLSVSAWSMSGYLVLQLASVRMPGMPTMWHGTLRTDGGAAVGGAATTAAGAVQRHVGLWSSQVAVSGGSLDGGSVRAFLDGPEDGPAVTLACTFRHRSSPREHTVEARCQCRAGSGFSREIGDRRWSHLAWAADAEFVSDLGLPAFSHAHVTLTRCNAALEAVMDAATMLRWHGPDQTVDVQFHMVGGGVVWLGGTVSDGAGAVDTVLHASCQATAGPAGLTGVCDIETGRGTVTIPLELGSRLEPVNPIDSAPWAVRQIARRVARRLTITTHVGSAAVDFYGRQIAGPCVHERHVNH